MLIGAVAAPIVALGPDEASPRTVSDSEREFLGMATDYGIPVSDDELVSLGQEICTQY